MAAYDHSPSRLEDPIDLDEAKALAENPKLLGRDLNRIGHYTQRVYYTLRAVRDQMTKLNWELQQLNTQVSARRGAPSTLDPRTAARYLTPEQLSELFEGHLRERVRHLALLEKEAKEIRSELIRMTAAIKLVLSSIEEDEAVPASVKSKLERVLRETGDPPEVPSYSASVPAGQQASDLSDLFS